MPKHSKPPVFTLNIPVRWSDQDKYGHVNNVAAFQYFEEIRGQWLTSIGYHMDGKGTGPILLKQDATYLKEIHYPQDLWVEIYVCQPGNTSFSMFHRIMQQDKETVLVEGNVKCVWVDHEAKKSLRLPDPLREFLLKNAID